MIKLPAEHQQVWLRLIEQRYTWSVLITMKPEDAEREQARVAKILHQQTVGWKDLVLLLRQLDQREKAAIARMVRMYRAAVYENFKQSEHEFVRRRDAWFRIWSAWEKAGSPPEQQDRLMDWLAAAIKASSKTALGPLPADPRFGPDVELVPEALVKQLTAKPGKSEVAQAMPAVPRPQVPLRGPLPAFPRDPAWGLERLKMPEAGIAARPAAETMPPLRAAVPPARLPKLPAEFRNAGGPRGIAEPVVLTARPPTHFAAALIVNCAASAAPGIAAATIAGGDVAKPQALTREKTPIELPPPRTVGTVSEPSLAGLPPVAAPAVAPPREGKGAEPDPLETVSPRREVSLVLTREDLPSSVAAPLPYLVQRKPLGADALPPETPPVEDQHARVNVEELRTRIEGINLSLRALDGELNEKREYTSEQLESLLGRLDILVLRQKDLTLFRDLLTPPEQAKVGQIDSSRTAVATLGTRIAELRSRVRQDESLGEAQRKAALKQLDDFSDRLATLTAEK